MNNVNVKKDYDWGLKKEQEVLDHLGKELGENFTKLGKFDHFDYMGVRNQKQCITKMYQMKRRTTRKWKKEQTLII